METKLLELSDRLKLLRDEKTEVEAHLKSLNEDIAVLSEEMVQLMTTEELSSFNRNGITFSMVVQEFPAAEPDKKPELWEAMKENGYGHLFSINSQTLQGTLKELIENNDGDIPDWLSGLIKIGEKTTIRVTKSKR